MFNFLYVLKHNPSFDTAAWAVHSPHSDKWVWKQFWDALDYFLEVANELDFAGRLNKWNHSPLFPYLVTLIGDTFPVGSTGGCLGDVLFQPKYADEVYKLLLLVDHLGRFRWAGGLACGARSDTRILKECGPEIKEFQPGEVMLMDGGFPGRQHAVIPWPKPRGKNMLKGHVHYNTGHSFIRGRDSCMLILAVDLLSNIGRG